MLPAHPVGVSFCFQGRRGPGSTAVPWRCSRGWHRLLQPCPGGSGVAPGAAAGTAPLPAVAQRIQPSLASSAEVRGSGTAPGRLKDSDRGLQVGSDLKSGFFPSLLLHQPSRSRGWEGREPELPWHGVQQPGVSPYQVMASPCPLSAGGSDHGVFLPQGQGGELVIHPLHTA